MVLRSVIGALVAVGAMGLVAAALPERHPGKHPAAGPAPGPAFGTLNGASATAPVNQTGSNDDRQKLLKLAGYSTTPPPSAPSPVAPDPKPITAPSPAPTPSLLTPPAQTVAIVAPAAAAAAPATTPSPPPENPATATSVDRANGRININRASVAELDRIPGGGRIGASIARRRPYHSIDDLVKKRVLREAAFQRIRSAITTD